MPKIINCTLSDEELNEIKTAIKKDPDRNLRSRAQVIHMLHLGKSPQEVAELLSLTSTTVYNWHARWRKNGLVGLANQSRSGRPKVGGQEYFEKLEEIVATDPREFGYGFTVWTINRLIKHMEKETGVGMSDRTMGKRLQELGYVYRRPKHTLENLPDKSAKEQANKLLSELKKERSKGKSTYFLLTKQQ